MTTGVKERLLTLIEHLNHGLVEREAAIKAALLAMLAGENMLLVGPPGTAKSLIARKLAKCLDEDEGKRAGKEYFEYLLTKFTTPEEIFGPLSISELKQDRFNETPQVTCLQCGWPFSMKSSRPAHPFSTPC